MRRPRAIVVAVIVIVLLLAGSQLPFLRGPRDGVRAVFSYPIRFVDGLSSRVSGAFKVLFAINDLAEENEELKQDKTELQAQLAQLQGVMAENSNFRQALGFKQSHPNLRLTSADVIGYSPTGTYQAITINKGSQDGLRKNQAVVSAGFLVGKIHSLSDHTAEVWLLANRNLITPVLLANTQTVGLMTGGIRGLVVENIPLDTTVTLGETVSTSSLEGLYPSGIAVGTVAEVISPKEEIFLTLRITNPITIGNLTSVFVIEG